MEPQEVDAMLRALVRMAAHQEAINTDLRACIDEQRTMNARVEGYMQRQDLITERLTVAIERLDVTQARIETLLARMLRQDGNGTDA